MILGKITKFKLKVFISSAMGTVWLTIRETIKNKLAQSEFLELFTIENHATEIESTQYFIWKVKQSDVVVILIKNEIRPGTIQEIETAIENKKPMIVYFINSDFYKGSVKDFKEFLISKDVTTFKITDKFEGIEEVVFNDVINNVIEYYKYNHDISNQDKSENYISGEDLFDDSLLDKESLAYFGSNSNQIIEMFSLS